MRPPELLAAACERTRGFPRALEALAAILAADRDASLPGLLTTAQNVLPDKIVEVLVGEAFERLDPLGQQVMQALAIYAAPVPPVAVDYLLQPFQPAIDSSPVLSRLVNMHFARRDAGRYYLHQVDRDYALGHIPPGQPGDQDGGPVPFTRYALQARAADYFEQTRTPRDSWRSLDDLAAQLAEFELRYANADYDTAAAVLDDIDFDYLQKWGHYRLAADMHERLNGRLTDLYWQMVNAGALGSIYCDPGADRAGDRALPAGPGHRPRDRRPRQRRRVAGQPRQQLRGPWGRPSRRSSTTSRPWPSPARSATAATKACGWATSATSTRTLGQTEQAIEHYQQALAIARETGDRGDEGAWLGNLGNIYADLGQTEQAIEHYQQALAIARETGDRGNEGMWLGNLGSMLRGPWGRPSRRSSTTSRPWPSPARPATAAAKACGWATSATATRTWGRPSRRSSTTSRPLEIGDDTGNAQIQAEARLGLAQVHLYRQEWPEARQVAEAAPSRGYPLVLPQMFAALGTAYSARG